MIYNECNSIQQEVTALKIALTADNHLTTKAKNPERFQALADIYQQCGANQIQLLIIAGDLFDQSMVNYAEFEDLYKSYRPHDLTTVIIPGNHDLQLNQGAIAGDVLIVYSEPVLKPLNDSRKILFLPYQGAQTMGKAIAPFAEDLDGQRWILIGHGDWSSGINSPDPYEQGVYMPLTSMDLKNYQPEMVFLGHIHLPQDGGLVHYPGSPCPINITETGIRRFLILDTDRGEITSKPVNSQLVYFDERFVMLPMEHDLEQLITKIHERIKSWNLPSGWDKYVQVRVKVTGSALSNRQKILDSVKRAFAPFAFYQDGDPDLSELIHNPDPERAEIANQVQAWIMEHPWDERTYHPSKEQILEEALKLIYQAGK